MTEQRFPGQQGKDDPDELVSSGKNGLLEGQPVFDPFTVIALEEIIELDHPDRHEPDDPSEMPVAPLGDPAVPLILAGLIGRFDCARPYIHSIHPPMLRKWARILSEMLQTANPSSQSVQHDSPCSLQHLHSDCHAAFCRSENDGVCQYWGIDSIIKGVCGEQLRSTYKSSVLPTT